MEEKLSPQYNDAVQQIKTAILKSQAKALAGVNQEQLALYYGIGRFISVNTREGTWGKGALETISRQLRAEVPGLRGFSATNLKLMRIFYEEWKELEANSSVATDELQLIDSEGNEIRQLQLTNYAGFPIVAFLSIGFTHHSAILAGTKSMEERKYYIQICYNQKLSVDGIQKRIAEDAFHNQGKMPNNFVQTIPGHKQAFKAIQMFKDEYLLDFINVEQLGEREEDIDERVIENEIVHNVKNFIITFGKGFSFSGSQVHYDKLGQLSHYLHVLDDDDRLEWENPPVGIILCKDADKTFVEYVLQDYQRPMGVATYKTNQEKLKELLPDEEEMKKLL